MRRSLMGTGILFLAFVFLMISCASSDPVEDTTPAPPPPAETPTTPAPVTPSPAAETPAPAAPEQLSQQMIDDLNAAKSLAETNRGLSLEVDGPIYFSNEWNGTESRYTEANGTKLEETPDAYRTALNTYTKIAADFEKIAADALPLYAADLRKNILAERAAALDAGILDISPDRFAIAENYAVSADAAWENGEYKTAITIINAKNALPRYTALKIGAQAYHVRMEIDYWIYRAIETQTYNASIGIEYGDYSSYKAALDAADETAFLAITQYDADDMTALKNAEKALSDYTAVLADAWAQAASIAGEAAAKARTAAMNAKAPVAAKSEYDRVNAIYTQGQTLNRSKDNQGAAALYYQSIPMFRNVAELAEYKRQQALTAIDEAERKIAQSEQTADDAEIILEGGAQ